MADLITHIAIAHVLKRWSPFPSHPLLFALGTSLPDLIGRAPGLAMYWYEFLTGWDAPAALSTGLDVFHTPFAFTVTSLFVAYCTKLEFRRTLFWNLLLGGYLHFLVDLTQTHMDSGYRLFFPFSWREYELGWIGTEATVLAAPFLALAALAVEWRYRRKARQAQPVP